MTAPDPLTPAGHLARAEQVHAERPEKETLTQARDRWAAVAGHAALAAAGYARHSFEQAEENAAALARLETRLNAAIVRLDTARVPWWRRLGGGS